LSSFSSRHPGSLKTGLEGHLIMRRIVVTGLGCVSPLGCGSELTWSRLLSARSGLTALPEWAAVLPARVAGIVPIKIDDVDGGFDPDLVVPPKDQRRMDRFILFALVARWRGSAL
jgi:3-oxoacyl-[acyl-carrier-protein] synthase II